MKNKYIYRTKCGAIVMIHTAWTSGRVKTYTKTGEQITTNIGDLKRVQ